MDQGNDQTQVGGTPPMPVTDTVQPAPAPMNMPNPAPQVNTTVVNEPVQPAPVQPTPEPEKPKGGSAVMKIAIWILVAALLVVVGYVVYANFISPAPTAAPVIPVTTEVPAPVSTESAAPLIPASTESPIPTESPVSSPSATP